MLYDLKGFINITALHDSANDSVSSVGELSELADSFARDKTYFKRANEQVEFVAFTSKIDKVRVVPKATYTMPILDIAQWVYSNAINGTLTNDQEAFQRLFVGQFGLQLKDVFTGAMVDRKGNWFPSWLTFTIDHEENNEIQLYFSDDAFQERYKDFEIYVVTPIDPVDTFQGIRKTVEEAMAGWNLPDHSDKVNRIANGVPYTYLISNTYTWHDREDFSSTMPTNWSVIVYGAAGANPTNIKQAYREHILANSEYPHSDWVKVFPEIFTTTMFTFVPAWENRGVPNKEKEADLYSPILPYDFIIKAATRFMETGTAPVQPDKNPTTFPREVTVFPTLYKSLNTVCIAGDENREELNSIFKVVPDYALISAQGPDIARVSKSTYDWIRKLIECIIAAEDFHPTSTSHEITTMVDPQDDTIMYYVFEENNIEFRVVSRKTDWDPEPI